MQLILLSAVGALSTPYVAFGACLILCCDLQLIHHRVPQPVLIKVTQSNGHLSWGQWLNAPQFWHVFPNPGVQDRIVRQPPRMAMQQPWAQQW